ncbi:MAG: hypothetical protein WBB76_03775, partial [Gaiellaceae bacterium]
MIRRHAVVAVGVLGILAAATIALVLALATGGGSSRHEAFSKFASGEADAASSRDGPGLGPSSFDAYLSAEKTYPANSIPPSVVQNAKATFDRIAKQTAKLQAGSSATTANDWQQYGPQQNALEPGVLAFSGATNTTASRVTAMVIAPTCVSGNCRLWVGVSGGSIWRTDDALAANPSWTWVSNDLQLAQNSVGTLTADPNDPSGNTLYLGTGEANRCSSGCEAGVGIYKTTNGGD